MGRRYGAVQRIAAPRPGYVYVLGTAFAQEGTPVVKIGMTTRTPETRATELSRGGPAGMILLGFVTSQDARAVERAAHAHFKASKVRGGGGTEYFSVEPEKVLDWLRAQVPKLDLESARRLAWKEYTESPLYKRQNNLWPIFVIGAAFWIGLLWHPNPWVTYSLAPAACFAVLLIAMPLKGRTKVGNAKLAALRAQLEHKYHLPPGGVRF